MKRIKNRIKNRNSSYAEKLHHQKFRFRQRFSSPGPVGTIPASSCSRTSCICRLTRQGRQRSTRLSRGSRGRCAPPQQRLGRRLATGHWDHGWHRGSWHRGWCSRGCCSWRGCSTWRRWCQGTHPRHQSPRLQALRRLRLRQWPQRGYALWQLHGLTRTMLGWMHGHRMHRMGGQRVKTDPRRAREHCDTTSACVFCISLTVIIQSWKGQRFRVQTSRIHESKTSPTCLIWTLPNCAYVEAVCSLYPSCVAMT